MIAILHFTASPAIGGVEAMIDSQCEALRLLGHDVRLLAGEGAAPPGAAFAHLPELHPSHPEVLRGRSELGGLLPPPDHPLVERTAERVSVALGGCDQCWVHNALTVYLNPFLTVALLRLVDEMPEMGWVGWCHDLSNISAYWPHLSEEERARVCRGRPQVTYVTISRARRAELAQLLSLDETRIGVIPPPLDVYAWLGVGPEAREVARQLDLEAAEPLVLVPSKLLPHKNLELAVHLGGALRSQAARPVVLLTGAPSPHEQGTSESVARRLTSLARQLGAADAVHLLPEVLGRVPERGTVRDLMLLSDLVLLPSREEGFGVPIQEAAALRTPVLCSAIPAFGEVGGGYAQFFSPDAPLDSIAAQVVEIMRDPVNQKRREVLRSGRRYRAALEHLARR